MPAESAKDTAGLGFGRPRIPYDNKYAARELQSLMRLKPEIEKLRNSLKVETTGPTVDLSEVQLIQQSWAKIDFAWLDGHFFLGIDLRGANLTGSIWGESSLGGESSLEQAHLQCANLDGAKLRGTRLVGADLRGANLTRADFTGAVLDGVKLDGAHVSETKGLPQSLRPAPGISVVNDGIDKCLDHWSQPAAAPRG